jgi:hypothetical protein
LKLEHRRSRRAGLPLLIRGRHGRAVPRSRRSGLLPSAPQVSIRSRDLRPGGSP